MRSWIAVAAIAALVSACTASTEPEAAESTSEAVGHCRTVCPKCHPGQPCIYATMCILDCSEPPARCVDTAMCAIGYAWSSTACSCVPTP